MLFRSYLPTQESVAYVSLITDAYSRKIVGHHVHESLHTESVVKGLQKAFGDRLVLRGINLHIPAGQFVAIVGRSGCGKSTLMRLLAGLDQPTGGELLAGSAPLQEAREDTRLMFQEARLLPWKKVIDNVGLGLKGDWRPKALKALEEVGLAERANEWPAAKSLAGRLSTTTASSLLTSAVSSDVLRLRPPRLIS